MGSGHMKGTFKPAKLRHAPAAWLCEICSQGPTLAKLLSQALEQLLPVKFIKHNLFPLILIYFPIKRKHPIVPPPTNL